MTARTIEVLDINTRAAAGFEAAEVEAPSAGAALPGYVLRITGWAVSRSARLEAVVVGFRADENHTPIVRSFPAVMRTDVRDRFPSSAHALHSGFDASLTLLGLPLECELRLQAVLEGGGRETIASLRVRRDAIGTGFQPKLDPLVLTCEPRSGSTWVTHLLGSHPEIVAFEPFRFEPRIATYWASMLRMLSDPLSWSQELGPHYRGDYWWTGEARTATAADLSFDPGLDAWLARDAVEDAARFCQERIDRFYARAAGEQSKPDARCFVERGWDPGWFAGPLVRELYPGARELFLVRDFRDVVCSMFSYSERIGRPAFGLRTGGTEEEFVRNNLARRARRLLEAWERRREQSVLVRYEDLVLESEPTLGSLLEALGLASDPATVRETLERAGSRRGDRQSFHITASDQSASVGRWREELSPSLQEASNEAFSDALRAFGYS
jgi:hypothetical protein